ncbi:hypothetical protein JKP88DRAFT_241180 [Tribonema minus]|uniref:Uncharacterized protein n=1 Tax=Tribonema minus TaxID=303371 RepID=A0A835Z622_9STRA|nr:hypothetical protein JKP88DRAFT_241180 [Tribonema minus]
MQNQIWAEEVPGTAPADLVNATLDDLGNSIIGSFAGKTSTLSPMIRKYVKVPLVVIAGSGDAAYESPLDGTYGRVLQSAIPFNTDDAGSYLQSIYKSTGVEIPFGSGSWLLDPESGVVTFYDLTSITGVSAATPILATYYRYVGKLGAATSEQTAAAISDQELTFTKTIKFDGGSTTVTDDALASIVLDDRDLASMPTSTPCMSLQIGGDSDGSWRLVTYGGGGSATGTSFEIQCRVSGTWVTKSSFTPV